MLESSDRQTGGRVPGEAGPQGVQSDADNPYVVAMVRDEMRESPRSPWTSILMLLWPVAVLINLPVPVWLGWGMTERSHVWVGMPAGILFVTAAGWLMIRVHPRWMRALMIGSVPTAISQFGPVVQLWIGMLACAFSEEVFGDPHGMQFQRLFPVFVTTVLTGLGLILLSLLIGIAATAVFGLMWNSSNQPASRAE